MFPTLKLEAHHTLTADSALLSAQRPVDLCLVAYHDRGENEASVEAALSLKMHVPPRVYGPDAPVEPHNHEFYEIVFVLDGAGTHVTGQIQEAISPGTVIVVPPGLTHSFENYEHLLKLNVYYIPEWVADDLKTLWRQEGLMHLFLASAIFKRPPEAGVQHLHPDQAVLDECVDELRALSGELHADTPSLLYVRSSLLKVLVRLSQAFEKERSCPLNEHFREEIWIALDHLETKILRGHPPAIHELTDATGLSPDYFTRLFREATGWAPLEYFQRRRVQHAARMLLQAEYSVTQVAHSLGFSDSSHLSRMFRQYQGMSPRQYRQAYFTDKQK